MQATIYELQELRFHLCGKVFTPQAPEAAGQRKYMIDNAERLAVTVHWAGGIESQHETRRRAQSFDRLGAAE